MTARSLALSAIVLLACGAGACGTSSSTPGASGAEGDPSQKSGNVAADFSARDVEGKTVRLSDYLGKQVILIDFWATWCEPCLAEMSHLRKMYEANKGKGFVILAVSMDGPDTVAEVPSFAKRNGMVFPVLLDEDSHVASIYNPKKAAPLSILIDKSGKVIKTHEGYNPGDEEVLGKEVAAALAP